MKKDIKKEQAVSPNAIMANEALDAANKPGVNVDTSYYEHAVVPNAEAAAEALDEVAEQNRQKLNAAVLIHKAKKLLKGGK